MSGVRLSGSLTTEKGKGVSIGVRNKDKPLSMNTLLWVTWGFHCEPEIVCMIWSASMFKDKADTSEASLFAYMYSELQREGKKAHKGLERDRM